MQLSEHFTKDEMLRSDFATRKGIVAQFDPPVEVVSCLIKLCINVLEPLRVKLNFTRSGQPQLSIRVSSGYRCLQVNTGVGGQPNSQHLFGEAADIEVDGMTVDELYQFIKKSGIAFDQLINEFGRWVHISFNPNGKQRGECLLFTKNELGRTINTHDGYISIAA